MAPEPVSISGSLAGADRGAALGVAALGELVGAGTASVGMITSFLNVVKWR
jgi:hypothetical protein